MERTGKNGLPLTTTLGITNDRARWARGAKERGLEALRDDLRRPPVSLSCVRALGFRAHGRLASRSMGDLAVYARPH